GGGEAPGHRPGAQRRRGGPDRSGRAVTSPVRARQSRPAEPHFFGAPGQELFAWFHAASDSRRRGAAVVCCPPFGFEYTSVYRTWRVLAERLAGEGFDVLRLDYPGTGNSTRALGESGVVGAWVESVGEAVAEARRLRPRAAVGLLGVRLGAVLAASAAA